MKGNAFGEQLRRAREVRGVTLDKVAEATRIPRRHLEALERSELEALPAGPFAKGYIEAYARFLGMDPRPVLETYRARQRGLVTPDDDRRLLDELSHLVERRGGGKTPASPWLAPAYAGIAVLVIVVLAGLGWVAVRGRGRRPAAPGTTRPPSAAAAIPGPAAASPRTPPRAPASARPSPKPTVVPPTATLEVREHGVGTGVTDHRLVGRSDRFSEGATVVFWTAVVGGRTGQLIRHVWFQGGRAVLRVELPIRGPLWRTQSRLWLPRGSAGPWRVEARASDGRLLARDEFACEPAP